MILAVAMALALGAESERIHIEQIMSEAAQRDAGMDKLTPAERGALEESITRFVNGFASYAREECDKKCAGRPDAAESTSAAGAADARHAATLALEQGMSRERVKALLGKPASTELSTCGHQTRETWSCLLWFYSDIHIRFEKSGRRWVVNSWSH